MAIDHCGAECACCDKHVAEIQRLRFAEAEAMSLVLQHEDVIDRLRAALAIGIGQLDEGDFVEGTAAELGKALRTPKNFGPKKG